MRSRLLAVGDVMLGENLYHYRRGIRTRFEGNYPALIDDDARRTLFAGVGWVFFNLECSLAQRGDTFADIESSVYVCTEEALEVFPSRIGRIVNVANNHFAQQGSTSSTLSAARLEESGATVIGRSAEPAVIHIGGRRVRIWGASLIPDARWRGEYFLSSATRLGEELSIPPVKNDEYWIVSLHWGREYDVTPDEEQTRIAAVLAGRGIDVILGHHPHVVQPAITIGSTRVFFSLGNFLFDQNFSTLTQRGLAAQLDLGSDVPPKCYRTIQQKYRIVTVAEEPWPTPTIDASERKRSRFMATRMKVELAKHFWEVDRQTLRLLARRALRKMRRSRE